MKSLISTLLLASTTLALPSPAAPRTGPSLRRANQIIPIVVGGPQDTFSPNSVVAAVGDILQFQFSNGNHTVTQSTSDAACAPMEGGVHSGHILFVDGQTDVGTFNMPVTSTDPMFLFCATGPHCQEGQVMIVNAANAQQIANYTKKSQQTDKSTDGTAVVRGTMGKIALDTAAFVPAPPKDAAAAPPPPPAAAEQAPVITVTPEPPAA